MTDKGIAAGSALEGLKEFTWSNDDTVAYEVAKETIDQVIARLTGLISAEKAASAPRADRIDELDEQIVAWIATQRALPVDDRAACDAVTDRAVDLLAGLAEGQRAGD